MTIAVGRRVGKTTFVKFLVPEEGAQPRFKGIRYEACYGAQGHAQAKDFFDECYEDWKAAGLLKKAHSSESQDRYLLLHPWGEPGMENDGARVWFISLDATAHAGFYGKGLHRGVIDEAAQIVSPAFYGTIMPMFATTKGKPLVIGTPYPDGPGFSWFEDLYLKGVPGTKKYEPDHLSFSAPTECNPLNTPDFVRRLRDSLPDDITRRCHIDGLFARDSGAVFENLDKVFVLPSTDEGNRWIYREAKLHEPCVAGLDFGQYLDCTVMSIFSLETREQLAVMRFKKTLYDEQMSSIHAMVERFGRPVIVADGREAGGHLVNVLRQRYGDSVYVVKWAHGGQFDKAADVVHGQRLFQNIGWKMIDLDEQRNEFKDFGRTPLPSGGWRYEAPPGRHDDFVAAALFAARRMPIYEQIKNEVEADPNVFDLTGKEPGTIAWHQFLIETQRGDANDSVYHLR